MICFLALAVLFVQVYKRRIWSRRSRSAITPSFPARNPPRLYGTYTVAPRRDDHYRAGHHNNHIEFGTVVVAQRESESDYRSGLHSGHIRFATGVEGVRYTALQEHRHHLTDGSSAMAVNRAQAQCQGNWRTRPYTSTVPLVPGTPATIRLNTIPEV